MSNGFKVVGYAKQLTVGFTDKRVASENIYIEASGKKLLNILCTLEAMRLKGHSEVDYVLVHSEFLTVTKEYKKEG